MSEMEPKDKYLSEQVLDYLAKHRVNGLPTRETTISDICLYLRSASTQEVRKVLDVLIEQGKVSTYKLNGVPRYLIAK